MVERVINKAIIFVDVCLVCVDCRALSMEGPQFAWQSERIHVATINMDRICSISAFLPLQKKLNNQNMEIAITNKKGIYT